MPRSTRLLATALPLACSVILAAAASAAPAPLLLRNPSLSRDRIAFLYAGDIWTVPREGGAARRLTTEGCVSAGPTTRQRDRRSRTPPTRTASPMCT